MSNAIKRDNVNVWKDVDVNVNKRTIFPTSDSALLKTRNRFAFMR